MNHMDAGRGMVACGVARRYNTWITAIPTLVGCEECKKSREYRDALQRHRSEMERQLRHAITELEKLDALEPEAAPWHQIANQPMPDGYRLSFGS